MTKRESQTTNTRAHSVSSAAATTTTIATAKRTTDTEIVSSPTKALVHAEGHSQHSKEVAGSTASALLQTLSALTFGPRNAFPLYVRVADLHNATDNGLAKLQSRLLGRLRRRVLVESAANSRSDSMFFVPMPENTDMSDEAPRRNPAPVEFAAVPPSTDTSHLVLATDDFEVALVGMHAVPQDMGTGNELLLYSVRDMECANSRRSDHPIRKHGSGAHGNDMTSGPGSDDEEHILSGDPSESNSETFSDRNENDGDDIHRRHRHRRDSRNRRYTKRRSSLSDSGDEGRSSSKGRKMFAFLNAGDDAKIHYDPIVDGHDQGTTSNTYVSVPGRKGLLLQHRGAVDAHVDTVEARFTVVEVDAVSPAQRRGVKKAGEVLTGTVSAIPFGKFVSPALGGLSSLANSALSQFEMPDHVISRDVMFRLLRDQPDNETATSETSRHPVYADNYLRYGYYFFLSHKVDAKLYAQNDTSSQTVPLLLRRTGRRGKHTRIGEREFFPLTGVNYVVMKVTPGCLNGRTDRTSRQRVQDRKRLEEILNMKKAMDLLRRRA